MKLASLRDGSRDGRLIVVNRALNRAVDASPIAANLQAALDDWAGAAPRLAMLAGALEKGSAPGSFALDLDHLAAPLPRAFGYIDSSVYLNHMELARALRGTTLQQTYREAPLISLRPPAPFLGPTEALPLPPGDVGLDLEAEIAAIVDDVPAGLPAADCVPHIKLLTLVNDTSLRTVLASELGIGRSAYLGKAPGAMGAVAVTPDELGSAWRGATIDLPLRVHVNGELIGAPHAGTDMTFSLADIIAYACKLRPLVAGTVVATGTISNRDPKAGTACIAERRMRETQEHRAARTPYLADGGTLRIEMLDADGQSVFGPIAQMVRKA